MSSVDFKYQYKTLSVEYLDALQDDIDKLKREGLLSDHPVYRGYLDDLKFELPENLPNARSIIVMAVFAKLMHVNFELKGKQHKVMVLPGYYQTGLSLDILRNIIFEKIIPDPGSEIELASQVHLKLLAARSGLGQYGRNNLCYVEEMGSLHRLFAYYTDYEFKKDNWTELQMMDSCKDCRICMKQCPQNCISEQNFVIDVSRCVTLYNEIEGEFPTWIRSDAHNALMGCMKCQMNCPANHKAIKNTGQFEDITEEETRTLLDEVHDDKILNSLFTKLRYPFSPETFRIFSRNLKVLID